MKRKLAILLCCGAVHANEITDTARPLFGDFPVPARAFTTLQYWMDEANEVCAEAVCYKELTGEFLFLDLTGSPTLAAVNRVFDAHLPTETGELASETAYVELAGSAAKSYYGKALIGILFEQSQMPLAKLGQIPRIRYPQHNEPFDFNGTGYTLRFEARCYPVHSSENSIAYDADITTVLSANGEEQELQTATKHRTDVFPYPSCEAAKANIGNSVSFDLVGDIDGDGKLDLVYLNNAGGEVPVIYLSSLAYGGQLVQPIFFNLSC